MSVFIKSNKGYFEVPDGVLKKCKISKAKFEKAKGKAKAEVAGQSHECNLVYLGCCTKCPHGSLWASCLK